MSEITLEQCIRYLAGAGASKNQVAKALNIHYAKFLEMCKSMPEVEWKPRGQTNGDIYGAKSKRGKCSPAKLDAITKATKASMAARGKFLAFGKWATIADHAKEFSELSHAAVTKRIREGMDIEAALTMPDMRGKSKRAVA